MAQKGWDLVGLDFVSIFLTHTFYIFPQSAQFYKVTNENYHKAADEVNAKFKWVTYYGTRHLRVQIQIFHMLLFIIF